jgi:predicted nucleotidyltransferase
LGKDLASSLAKDARAGAGHAELRAPSSIRNRDVRLAWPSAINPIVSAYDPVRVILFGSQARGDAKPKSDVDLLVVFDGAGDPRERHVGIRRLLNNMPFAKDVLVASTSDISTALAEVIHVDHW